MRVNGAVATGWLWTDTPDHVNVLAETAEGAFVLLRQSKYGLRRASWAVAGGFVEPGETPLAAARRELHEELGREAAPADWVFLGRYRSDANRGGGHVFSFLARRTRLRAPGAPHRPVGDLEVQAAHVVSRAALLECVMQGGFAEAKWTATVSLALLHLSVGLPSPALPLAWAMRPAAEFDDLVPAADALERRGGNNATMESGGAP